MDDKTTSGQFIVKMLPKSIVDFRSSVDRIRQGEELVVGPNINTDLYTEQVHVHRSSRIPKQKTKKITETLS